MLCTSRGSVWQDIGLGFSINNLKKKPVGRGRGCSDRGTPNETLSKGRPGRRIVPRRRRRWREGSDDDEYTGGGSHGGGEDGS